MALADYETLAADLTRDDAAKISLAEKDRAIAAAVYRYSEDKPVTKVQDVTPDSAQVLPLPAAWEDGFSTILGIEYPKGNVPPTLVAQDRYAIYDDGTAKKIQLLDAVAVAAANTRVSYTIKHVVSALADTIPVNHREPVCCLAAASLCDQLAAFYSGGTDSSIQADSVEQRSKSQEYSARARVLRKRYHDELGIEDKHSMAAGVVVNLDLASSMNEDRLTHGRIFR
jgi:hypothetical protein